MFPRNWEVALPSPSQKMDRICTVYLELVNLTKGHIHNRNKDII